MPGHNKLLKRKLSEIGPLSPAAWDAIALRMQTLSCRPHRSLPVHPGDALFLFEGLLKEETDLDDRLSIHQFVQEGDFFMAPPGPQRTHFVAIEHGVVGKISRRGLYELNRAVPELASSYGQITARSHQQLVRRIQLLLLPKRERYSAFMAAFPGLAARLLDKDILCYLDISPGYFSRSKG